MDSEGVTYQLDPELSSETAATYFRVEPESGDIVLQGDLTNELYTEYRLAITASDQGTPSLQTTVEVRVVVLQVVTLPPNTGVGFQEVEHEIQVMENTPQEAVLKTLQQRRHALKLCGPVSCRSCSEPPTQIIAWYRISLACRRPYGPQTAKSAYGARSAARTSCRALI